MTSSNPEVPNLHQSLLPPKPEPQPKKRGRKKTEEGEENPSAYDIALDNLSNYGPILLRARNIHGNYILQLKNDQTIDFHRVAWSCSGEDNFITLYRKTANHWQVIDVCIDDISTVTMTLPGNPDDLR